VELKSNDSALWICTDKDGGAQALVWNFADTFPGANMINQVFYKRDLPAQPKNKVTVSFSHLTKGKYTMELYKVGYRENDAHATYRDLGAPNQLTKAQVAEIKSKNSRAPS
jgi:xylan 1,4-beta-xylosidase